MNRKKTTRLKSVTSDDCPFLYKLLRERDRRANISHKKMPTYTEHVRFVTSKPYSKWYIIKFNDENAGSIYLTKNNEIGIFIKKDVQGRGIGNDAMKLLINSNPRKRYLANVSPKNLKSSNFFEKNGFKLIQHTYELTIK